jgi:hypothetical protein
LARRGVGYTPPAVFYSSFKGTVKRLMQIKKGAVR